MIKKAQSATELVLIICALLYFFIILLGAMEASTQDKTKIQKNLAIQEIVITLKQEIDLAQGSTDGYLRNFEIPNKLLNGVDYTIQIDHSGIYAITLDEKNSYYTMITNITGQPKKGQNNITKNNGNVYLNS